ncbi:phosphatase PAP2 family protein [Sporolactobacillus sp. THM7-7]|nr:phosphatase PAP2 family protein [Sporolactobacillus sp. THM7-7]
MLSKSIDGLYEMECRLFKIINRHYERKMFNAYFRTVTNIGGAVIEILTVLILLSLSRGGLRHAAIASAISLTVSHIIVQILKKLWPRKRPYLTLEGALYPVNPLTDHSFPSGHTTAVFSVIIPIIFYMPMLGILLFPIAASVAVSRIFLGLHYPSDVLAGICLGTIVGWISYIEVMPF